MADSSETHGDKPAPDGAAATSQSDDALPKIESPPLSPAQDKQDKSAESEPASEPASEPVATLPVKVDAAAARPRLRFHARHKRYAILAASVMVAAALGAVAGLTAGGLNAPAPASRVERQAMQNTFRKLTADIAGLKAKLAAAGKSARSAVPKNNARIASEAAPEPAPESAPETTGSIPPQPLVAPPLPTPRPASAARAPVVHDWSIRFVRGGYAYVRGRGDTYEVAPGAPLPGLGPVQEIARRHGRWVVVTPKGLIVSLRDRRFFERF